MWLKCFSLAVDSKDFLLDSAVPTAVEFLLDGSLLSSSKLRRPFLSAGDDSAAATAVGAVADAGRMATRPTPGITAHDLRRYSRFGGSLSRLVSRKH